MEYYKNTPTTVEEYGTPGRIDLVVFMLFGFFLLNLVLVGAISESRNIKASQATTTTVSLDNECIENTGPQVARLKDWKSSSQSMAKK